MAVVASTSIVGGGACALIVGNIDGNLPDEAGTPSEVGYPGDAASSDGGMGPEATAGSDGAAGCGADLDADPGNCGWCGHDCGASSCTGGACSAQTLLMANPTGLAYDQNTLFLTGGANGTIQGVPLTTLTAQTLAPSQNAAGQIHVHSPYVFWTTADGNIHRMLEDGGALGIAVPSAVAVSPYCIAANSSHLYWWVPSDGKAFSVPVDSDGSAPAAVEYVAVPGASGCVAADDQTLAVLNDYTLTQRDLDSGVTMTATLPNLTVTRSLVLAGAHAVAITQSTGDAGSTGHVNVVAKGSTRVVEVATFPFTTIMAVAGDQNGFYWSPQSEARIDGCSDILCTGGIHHYTPSYGSSTLGVMTVDPTNIYFGRGNSSAYILSVPR
jgi:hypothetical protein